MFQFTRRVKKGIVFIIAAMLIAGAVFISMPVYADGISAESTYLTKKNSFNSAKKRSEILLRWSKSSAVLQDGSVSDVSGYEIQYSTKKNFSRHKTITKSSKARTATIRLKKLNTKKKYKKNIKKYHIRIRSFVTVEGRKYYSKWNKAATQKKVRVYMPVAISSLATTDNVVNLKWNSEAPCDVYTVYNREEGEKGWTKKKSFKKSKKFADTVKYGTKYSYAVIGYKTLSTKNPSTVNTSCMDVLKAAEGTYSKNAEIEEFAVGVPEVNAEFKGSDLNITWDATKHAEFYYVEVSDGKSPAKESKVEKAEESGSFKTVIKGLKEKTPYYVRVRAAGRYMDGIRYSDYSEVQNVQYDSVCYTIKFIGNGADSGKMGSHLVERDKDYQLPANEYLRNGYVFAGWSTEKNSEINMKEFTLGRVDFDDQATVNNLANPNETITLYACWRGAGPEAAADWAIRVTKDDTFYYGPDGSNKKCFFCHDAGNCQFNCNNFCAASYQHGMPNILPGFSNRKEDGNFSQRNGSTEPKWWRSEGFTEIGTNIDVSQIQKGDIICCHNGKRWSHVMICASATKVAHAAKKGTGPDTITLTNMATKLPKYKKYTVLRLEY